MNKLSSSIYYWHQRPCLLVFHHISIYRSFGFTQLGKSNPGVVLWLAEHNPVQQPLHLQTAPERSRNWAPSKISNCKKNAAGEQGAIVGGFFCFSLLIDRDNNIKRRLWGQSKHSEVLSWVKLRVLPRLSPCGPRYEQKLFSLAVSLSFSSFSLSPFRCVSLITAADLFK